MADSYPTLPAFRFFSRPRPALAASSSPSSSPLQLGVVAATRTNLESTENSKKSRALGMTTTPGSHTARSKSAASAVLLDMADTTWRMFVPTIGLLLVGRHYDLRFGTKPWLMLVGVAVGALLAALLIRRQMVRPTQEIRGESK